MHSVARGGDKPAITQVGGEENPFSALSPASGAHTHSASFVAPDGQKWPARHSAVHVMSTSPCVDPYKPLLQLVQFEDDPSALYLPGVHLYAFPGVEFVTPGGHA
jgi:hypothetical protein